MLDWLLRRRRDAEADVRIAVARRTFDFRYPRRRRLLWWTWMREERWRFAVSALPIRELIVLHRKMEDAEKQLGRTLTLDEMCVFVTGSVRAVFLELEQLEAIWRWHLEANGLADPKGSAARGDRSAPPASPSSTSSSSSSAGPSASPSGEPSR